MLNIHFISIGGAAMHNLAISLSKKGYKITGSDDEIYEPSRSNLEKNGLLPEKMGWNPGNIHQDLDMVILGMHAREDNPELIRAKELGIRIESYPSFVYEQSKNKQRIVIAGSHGKTSITSMILHVLSYWNRKFDYLVGAKIEGFELMTSLTEDAPIIIIEGDEYLASPIDPVSKFLKYHPHIVLISGIAWDHINVFPTFESYTETFKKLIEGIDKSGSIIYDQTDKVLSSIIPKNKEGLSIYPYKAHDSKIKKGITYLKDSGERIPLEIFGEHNLKNLSGAKIVCSKIGISSEMFNEAIQSFKGAAKRLETIAENEECRIFKDFAHAPSKVAATVNAVKEQFPKRKLIAFLELHTYSSLNPKFLPEYKNTLKKADKVVIYLSEHAREIKRMDKIPTETIEKIFNHKSLTVLREKGEINDYLSSLSYKNENILMMSSGTFDGAIQEITLPS
ncbi:MAG: hypothetical protein RIR51_607 [Bacteroidota bacterium]|jgi:UDP-N-acetylmuramate: L-alanyl-gamma-D-glutamyl-meso-diaminopimelate ligase